MGRAKKQYEAKEIIRLGGNAPKNQKVPLIIKTGMNKKAKERAVKAETALKLLGMYVKKPKEKVERNDDDKGLDIHAGVGSFKAGVLKVNKDLFAQPSAVKRGPKPSGKGGARNGAKGRKRK
ncbi:hypothetical protein SARC_03988 [Sphaeroforma arctica JP610]|uniref:Uncharacterized protein n=1 Tax=Sphaeroforma arctica JP610 TaxID=667725 RepID=A0A0L0G4E7_9EUKA|nr:hypothetical protein SARC_03988 [Sphaeroforma arctica JP610]KNC83764.1 hypothetical protein SARC_03988 [Sphaeroforma arctica JP610]|eukprot:XP_014157666.1 hypothetical protein SARC_03988 [Sphaeroforma arctica JP610]